MQTPTLHTVSQKYTPLDGTIFKCHWKMENLNEVQKPWRNGFGTPPPICVTARLYEKFE